MCVHAQGEESFVFSFVYVCLLLLYFCYILIFVSMQCLEFITEVFWLLPFARWPRTSLGGDFGVRKGWLLWSTVRITLSGSSSFPQGNVKHQSLE